MSKDDQDKSGTGTGFSPSTSICPFPVLFIHCTIPVHSPITDVIQGVSRLWGITAGGDFLGLCDEKSSYKHVSDFGRLRSYGRFLIPVHALV